MTNKGSSILDTFVTRQDAFKFKTGLLLPNAIIILLFVHTCDFCCRLFLVQLSSFPLQFLVVYYLIECIILCRRTYVLCNFHERGTIDT